MDKTAEQEWKERSKNLGVTLASGGHNFNFRDHFVSGYSTAISDFKAALKEEIQKEIKGIDEHQGYSQGYINGMKNIYRLIDQVKPNS